MKVGATEIQPDGSDKKKIKKKRLPLKYNYCSGKMKWKMSVAFTKIQFNGQTKRGQERVVVTKICFHGSAKT